MSFTNTTKSDFNITDCNGELISVIKPQEKVSIRSAAQTINDKNYSPKVFINSGSFKIIMDIEYEEVFQHLKSNPFAYTAFRVMQYHIEPRFNSVVKADGKKFKKEDLAIEMGVCRQTASKCIDDLITANVLAECNLFNSKMRSSVYVINPRYCRMGKEIDKRIVDLFETKKATFRNDKTCDIPDGDSKNVNDD